MVILDVTAYNGVVVAVTNGLTLNGTACAGRADGGGYSHMNFYGTQSIGGTREHSNWQLLAEWSGD